MLVTGLQNTTLKFKIFQLSLLHNAKTFIQVLLIIPVERSQNSFHVILIANNHVIFYITNILINYQKVVSFINHAEEVMECHASFFRITVSCNYHHKIYLLFILQIVSILFKIKIKYEVCSKNNVMFECRRLYQPNWDFFCLLLHATTILICMHTYF